MYWIISKYLISAAVIVLVSEVARRNDRLGGLVAALPLVTILALIWMHVEKQPPQKIANQAWYTFWYVLPTLPMFLTFPWLFSRLGFWLALSASAGLTVVVFSGFAVLMRRFGVELM